MVKHKKKATKKVVSRLDTRLRVPRQRCQALIGPVTLNILEHKNGSRIILLGDMHIIKPDCGIIKCFQISIEDFLKEVFVNYSHQDHKIPLDFFLEDYYAGRYCTVRYGLSKSYITSVADAFAICLRPVAKSDCPYKNIRFHRADIRHGVFQSSMTDTERFELKKFYEMSHHICSTSISEFDRDIDYANDLLVKYAKGDPTPFLHMFKIDKQLRHLAEDIRNVLMVYVMIEMHKRIERLIKPSTVFNILNNDQNFDLLVNLFDFFMDVYIISRILRHDMRNIIMFVGDWHRVNIQQFFTQYLGYYVTDSKSSKGVGANQCINLRGVYEKFFHWS